MARKIQNLIGVRVERLHHLISGRSLAQFNTEKGRPEESRHRIGFRLRPFQLDKRTDRISDDKRVLLNHGTDGVRELRRFQLVKHAVLDGKPPALRPPVCAISCHGYRAVASSKNRMMSS
jgi:hypothetical protein